MYIRRSEDVLDSLCMLSSRPVSDGKQAIHAKLKGAPSLAILSFPKFLFARGE